MQTISFIIYDPKEENISIVHTFLPSTSENIKKKCFEKKNHFKSYISISLKERYFSIIQCLKKKI